MTAAVGVDVVVVVLLVVPDMAMEVEVEVGAELDGLAQLSALRAVGQAR